MTVPSPLAPRTRRGRRKQPPNGVVPPGYIAVSTYAVRCGECHEMRKAPGASYGERAAALRRDGWRLVAGVGWVCPTCRPVAPPPTSPLPAKSPQSALIRWIVAEEAAGRAADLRRYPGATAGTLRTARALVARSYATMSGGADGWPRFASTLRGRSAAARAARLEAEQAAQPPKP